VLLSHLLDLLRQRLHFHPPRIALAIAESMPILNPTAPRILHKKNNHPSLGKVLFMAKKPKG
jgi:hypothetical protein